MAEAPRNAGPVAGPGDDPGMPRWVKVFAVVALALALLLVALVLTGPGPGRHLP